MNRDEPMSLDDVDDLHNAAFSTRGRELDHEVPAFASPVESSRRRTRRNVVLTAAGVLVAGMVGMVAVGARRTTVDTAASVELSTPQPTTASSDQTERTAAGDTASVSTSEWYCRGELGRMPDGRELFAECVPIVEEGFTDWACTGRLGIDEIGRVRFESCDPVGQLGSLPGASRPPWPDELPLGAENELVAPGLPTEDRNRVLRQCRSVSNDLDQADQLGQTPVDTSASRFGCMDG